MARVLRIVIIPAVPEAARFMQEIVLLDVIQGKLHHVQQIIIWHQAEIQNVRLLEMGIIQQTDRQATVHVPGCQIMHIGPVQVEVLITVLGHVIVDIILTMAHVYQTPKLVQVICLTLNMET